MGYKAVYPQEAINGHRAYIAADGSFAPARNTAPPPTPSGRSSSNTKTGKTSPETVTAVEVNHDIDLYDLTIHTSHGTQVIHTTASHLFWNPSLNHGWIQAKQLKPGEKLKTPDGQVAVVVGGSVPAVRDGWMWDLTVPGNNDHDFYIGTTVADVLVHNVGGTGPCQAGKVGEAAAGVEKNTDTILINGTPRIPDELNDTTIGEVKNVAYQYLSSQLRDSLAYARQNNLVFNLYVRASTRLSVPLEDLVNSGDINRIDILP